MIVVFPQMVEYTNVTLYVNYSTSGTDNEVSSFEDGEILILEDTLLMEIQQYLQVKHSNLLVKMLQQLHQ